MYSNYFKNESFDSNLIEAVWKKGVIVPGNDPSIFRKDSCGAWIKRSDYGDVNSIYGWEIDHIRPRIKGGVTSLGNLQPLQWENNRYKSDDWPNWFCKIRA